MSAEIFIPPNPTVEDCWRGVVLYGRNTASYKFALATALLELKPQSGALLKMEDLAPAYAKSIAEHLKVAPKQITTTNGKFIQACMAYNQDQNLNRLIDVTLAHGFANVTPTTEQSMPGSMPRLRSPSMAPNAMESLKQRTAVGLTGKTSNSLSGRLV